MKTRWPGAKAPCHSRGGPDAEVGVAEQLVDLANGPKAQAVDLSAGRRPARDPAERGDAPLEPAARLGGCRGSPIVADPEGGLLAARHAPLGGEVEDEEPAGLQCRAHLAEQVQLVLGTRAEPT